MVYQYHDITGHNYILILFPGSDDPNLPMKKDGSLDWRRKENRKRLGTNEKGQPVNVTGTPDRRYKETKDEQARGQSSSKNGSTPSIAPVKKDGMPDTLYTILIKAIKESYSEKCLSNVPMLAR